MAIYVGFLYFSELLSLLEIKCIDQGSEFRAMLCLIFDWNHTISVSHRRSDIWC